MFYLLSHNWLPALFEAVTFVLFASGGAFCVDAKLNFGKNVSCSCFFTVYKANNCRNKGWISMPTVNFNRIFKRQISCLFLFIRFFARKKSFFLRHLYIFALCGVMRMMV